MAPNNLPIKLFSKRGSTDERQTEGGGGDPPKWVQTPKQLQVKAEEFRQVLSETSNRLMRRPTERAFIPAVVKVSLREEAMAKSYRGDVSRVFSPKGEYNLIGGDQDSDLMVKVDSIEALAYINSNLTPGSVIQNMTGLSAIERIQGFTPFIEAGINKQLPLKVKLVNFQSVRLNLRVESEFERLLRSFQTRYKKTRYTSGITVFKIYPVQQDAFNAISDFEALYSIGEMPSFGIGLDDLSPGQDIQVAYPVEGHEYMAVGVLDSGIAPIPHLAPWLLQDRRFTKYRDQDIDFSHGTFVSGVLLYGDELERTSWVNGGKFKLLDATVFPKPGIRVDEDELLENIEEAITANPDIRLWNLSGGAVDECSHDQFSDFGKALDELQQRFGILICKSAGNCYNFLNELPKSRIPKSADSVLSLVVGSLAHAKGRHDLAAEWNPSPFSRVGFGPNRIIKPELTHVGGNAGRLADGKLTTTGVHSFTPDGRVVQKAGTSFSTPRVTALLAGLSQSLRSDFDPLLLKTLAIHSAKYPSVVTLSPEERLQEMGFGMPPSKSDILYNSPHEITLILQDTIVKGGFIEIFDFPFPEELINSAGQYFGAVTVTLITGTRLDSTQGDEYCQSNIEISLGTYDSVIRRDTKKRGIINPFGKANSFNVLLPTNYASKVHRYIDHPFTVERQLRTELGKFHHIKKRAVNLQEMTEANRVRSLTAPKRWFLRLNGLFTHAAEMAAFADGEELSQEFCLAITIKDTSQVHDVYSSVTRLLNDRNFQHKNIELRSEQNIDVRGRVV